MLFDIIRQDFHAAPRQRVAELHRLGMAELRRRYPRVQSLHISMLKPVAYALENPEVLFPLEQAVPYLHLPGCLIPDEPDYHYSSFEQQGRYETDTAQELPPRTTSLDQPRGSGTRAAQW